jgi:hypothetical protein
MIGSKIFGSLLDSRLVITDEAILHYSREVA